MKTNFSLTVVMVLLIGVCHLQAQDFGSMPTSLANGIKPEAFRDSWAKKKDQWLKDVTNLKASDLQQSGKRIAELVKNLKDDAFNPDMKGLKKDLLGNLANLGSVSKLGETLTSLISGLNPNMLTDDFLSKKTDLLNGLKLLN